MLKCLICFIIGWLTSRMMGNGFSVGAQSAECTAFCDAQMFVGNIEDKDSPLGRKNCLERCE